MIIGPKAEAGNASRDRHVLLSHDLGPDLLGSVAGDPEAVA